MPTHKPSDQDPLATVKAVGLWLLEGWNLVTIAASLGVGWLVAKLIPGDWTTAEPWLRSAFAIAGTAVAFRAVTYGQSWIQKRKHPSVVNLEPHGGDNAMIVVRHYGHRDTLRVDAQVLEVHDVGANKSLHPYIARWMHQSGDLSETVSLGDDEWSTVRLASVRPQIDQLVIYQGSSVVTYDIGRIGHTKAVIRVDVRGEHGVLKRGTFVVTADFNDVLTCSEK